MHIYLIWSHLHQQKAYTFIISVQDWGVWGKEQISFFFVLSQYLLLHRSLKIPTSVDIPAEILFSGRAQNKSLQTLDYLLYASLPPRRSPFPNSERHLAERNTHLCVLNECKAVRNARIADFERYLSIQVSSHPPFLWPHI